MQQIPTPDSDMQKMGHVGSPETSVPNHLTLRNNPRKMEEVVSTAPEACDYAHLRFCADSACFRAVAFCVVWVSRQLSFFTMRECRLHI